MSASRKDAVLVRSSGIGARLWVPLVIVGLVGQLSWTVENMYLNLYIYDTITDDPNVLAITVAASAIVATLATLVIGAASDRARTRRAFIAAGYVLWGLTTASFGLISVDRAAGNAAGTGVAVAVLAIVVLDCVMSFFGSGANDAAFGAWVTDSTVPANRGRVDSVLAVLPLLAMLIIFGALDPLTQAGQWRLFFGVIGGVTAVVGVVAWFIVHDSPNLAVQQDGYLAAVVHGLRPRVVRAQPTLYLTLLAYVIVGTATQVFMPYLIIYVQHYLQIDNYPILLAIVLIGASVASVLGGRVIDRVGKLRSILPTAGILALGLIAMFFVRGMWPVTIAATVMMSGFMASIAAVNATIRDYTPSDRVGNVQGLRMIAAVLVPMVVGPFIGSAVILGAAETYVDLGQVKQVPTPWIFAAAAAVLLLLPPVVALLRKHAAAAASTASLPISVTEA